MASPPDPLQEMEHLRRRVAELEQAEAERAHATTALRETEARFRATIANLPGAVYRSEVTPPWRDLFVSEGVHLLCGYTALELTRPDGTAFGELILPEDRPVVEHSVLEAPRAGGIFETRYRIRHANGEIRWMHDQSRIVPGPDGEPRWLEGVVVDITDRMQAEMALTRSENQYKTLVASVPGAVYLCEVGTPWKDTFVSEGVRAVTGYSPADLLRPDGLTVNDLTLPEDLVEITRQVEAAIHAGQPFELRYRIRHADGSIRWVYDKGQAAYAPDGTPLFIGGVILDITDRMRNEAALRESEERFRTLVQSVPGVVYRCEVGFPYRDLFLSSGTTELTGRPPEAFLGPNGIPFGELILEADRAGVEETAAAAVREHRPFAVTYRIRHASGELRWVEEHGQATYGADGRPLYLDGVLLDITTRVAMEETRLGLEAQLRQSQKMEAIGTLAGGIAHDFNNILTAVIGNAELLQQDLTASAPAQDGIRAILTASTRARDLVQQILTFSRLREQERRPIRLDAVVLDVLRLLRATLPSTIEIHTDLDARHATILADPTQVHQAILNLCTNAAHAMRTSGGILELAVGARLAPESMTHRSPGPAVCLRIRDTGHGMDQATLDRIFEPFFTTKQPGEGTGLGLAVVHGIMRGHEGAVSVTSAPGHGTTFELFFPAVDGVVTPTDQRETPAPRGRGQHLLVVDDEAAVVRMATTTLERLGYRVSAYMSPAETLAAFEAAPGSFDLVLTDLTMPRMTGLELAGRLLAVRPELPILLTSGYSGALDGEGLTRAGIRELVAKPFRSAQLARSIARQLTGD